MMPPDGMVKKMRETIPREERAGVEAGAGPRSVLRRAGRRLSAFHREERGLNTVESLLLIAVAAIILIGLLRVFFPELFNQVRQKIQELFNTRV
jgi:Flp pilus assembly pilin Flp